MQITLTFDPTNARELDFAQAQLDSARKVFRPAPTPTGPRELTTCSAFPGLCEAYDEGMPMREIGARLLPADQQNGYAQWNILGAHGRRPNRRPRHQRDPEGLERRRMQAYAEHWRRYHPDDQRPSWISQPA